MAKRADLDAGDVRERLDVIVGLLACLVRNAREFGEQVTILDEQGLSSTAIARVLGAKPVTVRTALHRKRARDRGRRGGRTAA